MTPNAQKGIDVLSKYLPKILEKYILTENKFNFGSILNEEINEVFDVFSRQCCCMQDVLDIYKWFGVLPNWWNLPPFNTCVNKDNFYLFLYHYKLEKKHVYFLYKLMVDLKRTHLKIISKKD